jgi:hypothetical protein
VALERIFSEYFCFFPMSVSFRYYFTLIICMLLVSEEQAGEPWRTSNNQCCFGNRETLGVKVLTLEF